MNTSLDLEKNIKDLTLIKKTPYFNLYKGYIDSTKCFIKQARSSNDNWMIQNEISCYKLLGESNFTMQMISRSLKDEQHWIALRNEEGNDLEEIIKVGKKLSETEWFLLSEKIVAALRYIHSKQIIHRDIKPSNIYISGESVKIFDFAFSLTTESQLLEDEDSDDPFSALDDIWAGTHNFSSPEHFSGDIGFHMDVFSLGSTLVYLATGTPPFNRRDNNEIKDAVRSVSPNFRGLTNNQRDFLNPFFSKIKSRRIRLEQVENVIPLFINFLRTSNKASELQMWPKFTDLSNKNFVEQLDVNLFAKIKIRVNQSLFIIKRLFYNKKFLVISVLTFMGIIFTLRWNYEDGVNNRLLVQSEITSCMEKIQDSIINSNYYFSPYQEINLTQFKDDLFSCNLSSIAQDNLSLQSELAYYYGLAGEIDREELILIEIAKKDSNFIYKLINFYDEKNIIESNQGHWLNSCDPKDYFCIQVKTMYIYYKYNALEALNYQKNFTELNSSLEVLREILMSESGSQEFKIDTLLNFADNGDTEAQLYLANLYLSQSDFEKSKIYTESLLKKNLEQAYVLAAQSEMAQKIDPTKTLEKCTLEIVLPLNCIYLDSFNKIRKANEAQDQKESNILWDSSFQAMYNAALLGQEGAGVNLLAGNLFTTIESIISMLEDESRVTDTALDDVNWMLHHLYRDNRNRIPEASFILANLTLTTTRDIELACEFYFQGISNQESASMNLYQINSLNYLDSMEFNNYSYEKFNQDAFNTLLKVEGQGCSTKN